MIVLVLGGTRSGKSDVAEEIAASLPEPVTYLATALVNDPDFADRVARHRDRRPASWPTLEAEVGVPELLRTIEGTVLLESTGTWLAAQPDFACDLDGLCRALAERDGDTVIVGEEVGLAVHPPTDLGRRFVDALGTCNQRISAIADRAVLVVAGRTLELA